MRRYEIINKIIKDRGAKKYLEIGVYTGQCIREIKVEHKDGVDPGSEGHVAPEVTHRMTSNEFFESLDKDFKYDVIFIDGLHHSEQVDIDIENSLNHLVDNGVIVLHDCDPFMYEVNYIRVIEDYLGVAWNGTVWKTIYKLKATRPDLNICTVNTDEGVGLIKRESQELVPFDNPYFEYKIFQQNRTRDLNLISPEKISSWILD